MLQTEKYEQAIRQLEQAIAIYENYFLAYNDLAVAYLKLDKLDKAEEALRQAIRINDQGYLPQLNLGIVLNRRGKYSEATELLTNLEERYPELWQIHPLLIL